MNKYIQTIILIVIFLFISNERLFSQIIDENEKWVKVVEGLNFPEGPAYDGKSSIYLSNCYGGWITKYSDSIKDTFVSKLSDSLTIEKTNGLAFGSDGFLYVCEYGKGKILRINRDAKIEIYADG